jgi:hypothetical protein
MSDVLCALCGKRLPQRTLKYIVRIHIATEYDGFQPGWDDDHPAGPQGLFKETMDVDVAELEDLESEEVSVYLCMQCKKRFTRDLIEGEEEKPSARDIRIVYH